MAGWVRRLVWAGLVMVLVAGMAAAGAARGADRAWGSAALPSAARPAAFPAGISGRLGLWPPGPVLASGLGTQAARIPGAGGDVQGQLNGVTVLSRSSAWAVGYRCVPTCPSDWRTDQTLIRHWNGRRWSTVHSPNPGMDWNYLYSVSAVSASDAWAVGYRSLAVDPHSEISATLTLHWNGATWRKVPSPDPSGDFNALAGVSAVSARNAWTVGYYQTKTGAYLPLILRWNGKTWSRTRIPKIGASSAVLSAVSALSARDAWAVGSYDDAGMVDPLILHWNGKAWSKVGIVKVSGSFAVLLAVSALSASSAWAVGYQDATGVLTATLIMHWNGRTWSKVTSPGRGLLVAVAAASAANGWAVGYYCTSACDQDGEVDHAVSLHWNGRHWSDVPVPRPYARTVYGVAEASAGTAWAVGLAGSSTVFRPLILHWNGTTWSPM